MKSGWKTTEFWMALVAAVVGAMMAAGVFAQGSVAAKILGACSIALASFGYSLARGQAKGAGAVPAGPVAGDRPTFDNVMVLLACGVMLAVGGGCAADNASSLYAKAAASERIVLAAVVTYDQVARATGVTQADKVNALRTARVGTDALAALTDSLKANSDAYQVARAAGNDAAAAEATSKARIVFDALNAVATRLLADLQAKSVTTAASQ